MTRRDRRWRAAGLLLTVGGCAAGLLDREGSPLTLVYFLLAIGGIVLMLNGKRVPVAWQAERRGHGDMAGAIGARRLRRYRHDDPPTSGNNR